MLKVQNLIIRDPLDFDFELARFDFIRNDEAVKALFCIFRYDDANKIVLLQRKPSIALYSNDLLIEEAVRKWCLSNKESLVYQNIIGGDVAYSDILMPLCDVHYIAGNTINDIILGGYLYYVDDHQLCCSITETRNVGNNFRAILTNVFNRIQVNISEMVFEFLDPHHYQQQLSYDQVFNGDDDPPSTRTQLMTLAKISCLSKEVKYKFSQYYVNDISKFVQLANRTELMPSQLLHFLTL